jgi:SpoVK/Ycf46/Vps4 family AAA+-type ATPase
MDAKSRIKKLISMRLKKLSREKKHSTKSFTQWSVYDQGKFVPCFHTVKRVPAGVYEMKTDNQIGFHIERQSQNSDELIELPIPEIQEILRDIDNFWKRGDVFQKYGYTFKRGVLLYGPPGCGKSCLIQLLCKKLVDEMDGIVFNLRDSDDIHLYLECAGPVFRCIEPDRPIIVIMEDVDNIVHGSRSTLTNVLNMLDGLKQIDKVVYIGTTNYPELLQERISSRPSRFDRRYKIGQPSKMVRECYIKHKLKPEDLKQIDMKDWLKKTKGFSLAAIKELIVSVIILGISLDEALSRLKEMKNKLRPLEEDGQKPVGFTISVPRDGIKMDDDDMEEYSDDDDSSGD